MTLLTRLVAILLCCIGASSAAQTGQLVKPNGDTLRIKLIEVNDYSVRFNKVKGKSNKIGREKKLPKDRVFSLIDKNDFLYQPGQTPQ